MTLCPTRRCISKPLSLPRAAGPALVAFTLAVFSGLSATAQPAHTARFRHLSVEQGLSHEVVYAVLQDRQGLLWFGTQDGLNRYDGYDFSIFNHDPKDPTSLSNDRVWCLFEDSRGNIWIGTDGGGLNRFQPGSGTFERFVSDPANPFSLSSDNIRVIYEDRHGTLWVGTDGGGLNRLDLDSRTFTRFAHDPSSAASLSDDRVRTIAEDASGTLWVGTDGGGLNQFDEERHTFTTVRHDPGDPESLADDRVRIIRATSDGALWVGTYEHGLDRFDPATGRFTHFRATTDPDSLADDRVRDLFEDSAGRLWIGTVGGLSVWRPESRSFACYKDNPAEPASLSDDRINTVTEDAGGVLWVGTYDGLNKWSVATETFQTYRQDPDDEASLASNVVHAFTEDDEGNIWVGAYGGGLTRIDPSGAMTRLGHDPDDPTSLVDNGIMAVFHDSQGSLWVGTQNRGLDRLDPATGRFEHYRHDPDDPTTLSFDGVTVIAEDRFGSIWVGTFRGGLNRFNRETGEFARYRHDAENPNSLGSDMVLALHEDESGALWIGTDGAGLSRYDRQSGTFSHYRHAPGNPTSLSDDSPWSIHQDRRGGFWIGTKDGGLNYWAPQHRLAHRPIFRRYLRADGLPSSIVYGILEDDRDTLWLSTGRGLTRLTPSTGHIKNYDVTHGLQGNDFNFGAYYRSRDGRMFFGGPNGFNVFNPDDVRDNDHMPPIVLTEFLKFNKPVPIDHAPGAPIELGHNDWYVAFEFAALDYTAPERNRYRFMLEGFDTDWNDLGSLRRVTYTNLESGKYTLHVQASNNDGLWNEEGLSLAMVVATPPWRAWWAIVLYLLGVAGVGFAFVVRHWKKVEQQAEYSRRLENEVAERTQQLATQNRELADLNERLHEVSVTDSLTGLWNRRYLATEIPKDLAVIHRARIERELPPGDGDGSADPNLLFLMMDLDSLKWVNDTYGHQAGDRAIVQMKEILIRVCRQSDTLIRWGGDEFLLLGRHTGRAAAAYLAERIRHAVADHRFDLGDGDIVKLSCSIGFTFFPFMQDTPALFSWEQVLDLADRALYRAKEAGRNQWVGVLSVPGTDPAEALNRKDEELDTLARDGLIELHNAESLPPDPQTDGSHVLDISARQPASLAG